MKYCYEVVKYDKNVPGRILMQCKPGKRCDTLLHWHKELEFVYMINGTLDAKISGKNIQIQNGDFYFCNSEEIHITSAPDKKKIIKYIVILLSYEYMLPYYKHLDRMEFKIEECTHTKLKSLFHKLIALAESGDEYKSLAVNAVFMEIYHVLLSQCMIPKKNPFAANVPDNFIYAKKVIEYIGKNYKENITLKDMADLVGLTPAYFSKYFKNITETSLIQYLNGVRLEHALSELMFDNETVTKAALNNGFANVKSFIALCKKIYGCTPTQYKKNNLDQF